MTQPILSLICPARNAEDTIGVLVRSIAPDPRVELVLVDDASTDNTADAAIEAAKETGLNLRVIRNLARKKAGPSRNLAAREALGAFVWAVDADDFLTGDGVLDVLAAIEGNPGADCVICLTNCDRTPPSDPSGDTLAPMSCGPWSKCLRRDRWVDYPARPQDDVSVHMIIADTVENVACTRAPVYHYCRGVAGSALSAGGVFRDDPTLLSAFADAPAPERSAEWVEGHLRLAADLLALVQTIKRPAVRDVLSRRLRVVADGIHTGRWNY